MDARAAPRGLLSGLFNEKPKSKPAPKTKTENPAPVATDAAERQRQWNAVLRRMEVCGRLRRIAFESGNEELMRQADELEARAYDIYNRKTAHLSLPARAPESSAQADDKKPAARTTSRASGADDKELDAAPPISQSRPPAALLRLGGSFEQREQSILNDTSMGRDKP